MSMQEFEMSGSQQQELQQEVNADPREQYQEESRHEPYVPLLNAPYSIDEKIRPEYASEYASRNTSRAGFWPAIILMAALGLMGIGGLLGFGLSQKVSGPVSPVHNYYVQPHFDHRFGGPFNDDDGR